MKIKEKIIDIVAVVVGSLVFIACVIFIVGFIVSPFLRRHFPPQPERIDVAPALLQEPPASEEIVFPRPAVPPESPAAGEGLVKDGTAGLLGHQVDALFDWCAKLETSISEMGDRVNAFSGLAARVEVLEMEIGRLNDLERDLRGLASRLTAARPTFPVEPQEAPEGDAGETSGFRVDEPQAKMGGTGTERYAVVREAATADGRPMVILVGAKWCVPCKDIEGHMPEMHEAGHFVHLDLDEDKELSERLAGEGPIPRLAVYTVVDEGYELWVREFFVGPARIRALFDKGNQSLPKTAFPVPPGFRYGGANVLDSTVDETLQKAAQRHAGYMARVGQLGHQWWDARRQALEVRLGRQRYAEICAESWPRNANDTMEELWREMFDCWKQSGGHWAMASKRHSVYGSGMAKSAVNGVWYACIITADPWEMRQEEEAEEVERNYQQSYDYSNKPYFWKPRTR